MGLLYTEQFCSDLDSGATRAIRIDVGWLGQRVNERHMKCGFQSSLRIANIAQSLVWERLCTVVVAHTLQLVMHMNQKSSHTVPCYPVEIISTVKEKMPCKLGSALREVVSRQLVFLLVSQILQ